MAIRLKQLVFSRLAESFPLNESLKSARLATSLLFLLHGLIVATWLSRIPAIQTRLGLNPSELGLALLGTAAGALFSMPLTGALVTRLGSRPVAMISTALMSLALVPLAIAPGRFWLTGALVIFGVFSGAMNVSMNAQAVALEERYRRAILSTFHALFSLGGMAGAALGGIAAGNGISPFAQFAGSAIVFAGFALAVAPMLIKSDKGRPGQPVFARITQPLLGLGCLAFCILLNEGAMADWSSVYLHRSLAAPESVSAAGYAVFSFAMAGGRLAGDWMTNHFGRVPIVRFGALLSAVGLLAGLALATIPATFIAFGAVGAGFSVIVPIAFGAAGRNGASAGAGLAAVNTAGYLGFLSGPAIIGFTANAIGLRSALLIVAALSILVSLMARAVALPSGVSPQPAQEPVLQ